MILVDTSIWIEHFKKTHVELSGLLKVGKVVTHPFVVGELVVGGLDRESFFLLGQLPEIPVATHNEVMTLVEGRKLANSGITWIDAHLLTSCILSDADLFTLDENLSAVARRILK